MNNINTKISNERKVIILNLLLSKFEKKVALHVNEGLCNLVNELANERIINRLEEKFLYNLLEEEWNKKESVYLYEYNYTSGKTCYIKVCKSLTSFSFSFIWNPIDSESRINFIKDKIKYYEDKTNN